MKPELSDLVLAAGFSDPSGEAEAVLDTQTGYIYYLCDGSEDEPPEDIEKNERYVWLPSTQELYSGRRMALDFVVGELPEDYDTVRDYFSRKGAFSNLKQLIAERGKLDEWHAWQEKVNREHMADWCRENGIAYTDD